MPDPFGITRDLAAAMHQNIGTGTGGFDFWGTVTAINAGPPKTLTVKLNGSPTTLTCRYSASYAAQTPAVNDVVFGRGDGKGDNWAIDRLA